MDYLKEAKYLLEDWDGNTNKVGHTTAALAFAVVAIAERDQRQTELEVALSSYKRDLDSAVVVDGALNLQIVELEKRIDERLNELASRLGVVGHFSLSERLADVERMVEQQDKKLCDVVALLKSEVSTEDLKAAILKVVAG
jgi:hypothetical protein